MANKGEWSEIYVALKLLGEGTLHAADQNLEKLSNVFYPVLKILRSQSSLGVKLEYVINGEIKIVNGNDGDIVLTLPTIEFVQKAKELYALLKKTKGKSFALPEIEEFLSKIFIQQKKSSSRVKEDITIVIHDLKTGIQPIVSFSIKSLIGNDSTLLNPNAGTNFIYKISVPPNVSLNVQEINENTYVMKGSKITNRLKALADLGCSLEFTAVQSKTFYLNMQLIDSDLPKIISYMLLYKYLYSTTKTIDLLNLVEEMNPMNYDTSSGHPFYKYKVRGLLYDYALGMTAETVWKGSYSTTGGIIIVKENGDVLCYHVYDKNVFQDYLLEKTYFEQASTGEDEDNPGHERSTGKKYYYGWIYKDGDEFYIKLNLQIRFSKVKKKTKKNLE
jgi:hypothetical protein